MIKNYQIQMVKKGFPWEAIETTSVSQLGGEIRRGFKSKRGLFLGEMIILGTLKRATKSATIESISRLHGCRGFRLNQGRVMSDGRPS